MGEKSAIAWTRSTFNPWIGCTKVGPGCDHCYAEALDKRHKWGGAVHWGSGVPRYRTSPATWAEPLKWEKKAAAGDKPWRVFCASLADVFDNEVPRVWRYDLWRLIEATPNLSWLLVTKRVGNVVGMVPVNWEKRFPDNVRLLITVCNQEEADRDVPKLLALPCKNGISYEPALGPVDWWEIPVPGTHGEMYDLREIGWIICGGESTQGAGKARPFDLAWARSTVEQCKAAGVPCFVKQLGSHPYYMPSGTGHKYDIDDPVQMEGACFELRRILDGTYALGLEDRAGADPAEWPADLRMQESPA